MFSEQNIHLRNLLKIQIPFALYGDFKSMNVEQAQDMAFVNKTLPSDSDDGAHQQHWRTQPYLHPEPLDTGG